MNQQQWIGLSIDGIRIKVAEGTTLLKAAKEAGIEIPTLCCLEESDPKAVCRLCVVETEDGILITACSTLCAENMCIQTHSKKVREARRFTLKLLLTRHLNSCFACDRSAECADRLKALCNYDKNCFTCGYNRDCKLRRYCLEYNVDAREFPVLAQEKKLQKLSNVLIYDPNRCILCRNCKDICSKLDGDIALLGRGINAEMDFSFCDSDYCMQCGKCMEACPTGALSAIDEKESDHEILAGGQ